MTNKKLLITILTLTSILITSGFSLTPLAYSTGSNYGYNHDDDDDSNQIPKGLCKDSKNLLVNGCFEKPTVPSNNNKYWNIYDKTTAPDLGWDVLWLKDIDTASPINPCITGEPGFNSLGLLELQRGILGGPSEGYQHAELDSDCNGPVTNTRSGEKSSVGISQTITTSENSDYKITFAYKARPDQPLSTNGLMVIWNDGMIANNLEFSKKDWKYASIIVHGITGLTKLSFEDTGEPDSLGTFLDDVSVIPIPKPMSSITLKKAITNDNSGTAGPSDFVLKIKNIDTLVETVIPQGVETSIPAGTYTMSESGPTDYSFVLIAGDDSCPTMLNSESFTLKKGENTTCVIYNDDNNDGQTPIVDPPTITIVNDVESTGNFDISVSGSTDTTVKGATHTYTVGSHTPVTISGSDGRSILITGDGNCPENIGGFVNIENGQHITCTYSDRPVIQPGGGIIFRNNSMKIQVDDNTAYASCDRFNGELDPGTLKNSCIEILDPTDGTIGIVDSALTSDTTIVLFSVVEAGKLGSTNADDNEAITPACMEAAIVQHNNTVSTYLEDETDNSWPTSPSDNNVVVISCPNIDPTKTYNVNYIMIDPLL